MRESYTNGLPVIDPANGPQPAAKSLFHKILRPKSLRLKILRGHDSAPRPQVVRNEDFTKSDEKKSAGYA
jgi:hypothetical protein